MIKSNSTVIQITYPCWYSNRHFVVFSETNSDENFCYENDFFHCYSVQPLSYPIFFFTKVFVVCGIYGIYQRVLGGCWRKSVCVAELQNQCRGIWPNTNRRVFVKYILREKQIQVPSQGLPKLVEGNRFVWRVWLSCVISAGAQPPQILSAVTLKLLHQLIFMSMLVDIFVCL